MRGTVTINQLCVATVVATTSDRFGVPPAQGAKTTASGFPLAEDPDEEGASAWADGIAARFSWLFESELRVEYDHAPEFVWLIRAAFEGDEVAVAKLRARCGATLN